MLNSSRPILFTVALTTLFSQSFAQALTPSVGEVKDSRTTGEFFAELEVELKFIGDEMSQYKAVRSQIETATDDTGKNLIEQKNEEPTFEELGGYGSKNSIRLKFKNPARKAAVISQMKGKFEFYNPEADPNATVKIDHFLGKTGKLVSNTALSNAGISLTILTNEDLEKRRAEEQKKAQEEARKQGATEDMIQAMGSMMGGFFGTGDNTISYEIEDPKKRLVSFRVVDAGGKEIDRQSIMTSGNTRQVDYQSKVPADATLELQLLTDKAVAMIPVDLSNIALP